MFLSSGLHPYDYTREADRSKTYPNSAAAYLASEIANWRRSLMLRRDRSSTMRIWNTDESFLQMSQGQILCPCDNYRITRGIGILLSTLADNGTSVRASPPGHILALSPQCLIINNQSFLDRCSPIVALLSAAHEQS